jgi:ketosteroid isomerase-like protein
MARTLIALTLLLAASFSNSLAQQAEPPKLTKAEEDARKLERQWLDAYEKKDAEAMGRIAAEDFVITFPNGGMQTKPQLMAMIKAPRRASEPEMRFRTEDVRSRAYGDTVILMGIVVTEYERGGKPVIERSRYTDTYVRTNGRWQVVASHLSNVEGAQ